jgi:hypothetical protein
VYGIGGIVERSAKSPAAGAIENFETPDLANHLHGFARSDGSETKRDILHHLGKDAAMPPSPTLAIARAVL